MKRQKISQNTEIRLWVVIAVMLAGVAGLLWRAVFLQIEDASKLQAAGEARYLHTVTNEARRGMLLDRRGEPLAISTPVQSICVKPALLMAKTGGVGRLAEVLQENPERLQDELVRHKRAECYFVKRRLPPHQAEQILANELPGVYSRQEYRRYYPAAGVASQLIGITNVDDQGLEGLELAFNHMLTPAAGKRKVIRDRKGRIIKEVESISEATPGQDIPLSVDLRIQSLAYQTLFETIHQEMAQSGSVVVLKAASSEVLAMVNLPSYNPNSPHKPSDGSMRNRAVTDTYEPGSIIKPVIAAAALESGRYRPDSMIKTASGRYVFEGHTIRDISKHGNMPFRDVIKYSSNVGMSKIALSLDSDHLWNVLRRFGFGDETYSAFPGEAQGLLPHHESWHDLEKATLGYGYRLSVTTLQMAEAYAIIANEGVKRAPSFVKDVVNEGSTVIDPEITRQLMKMMEAVVQPDGTGKRAVIPHYRIAGKTGTSHKSGKGGYQDRYVASFAGIAPVSNPEIVVVVTVNDPGGERYYGGQVAAPVFREVMEGSLRLMNIAPDAIDYSRQLAGGAR